MTQLDKSGCGMPTRLTFFCSRRGILWLSLVASLAIGKGHPPQIRSARTPARSGRHKARKLRPRQRPKLRKLRHKGCASDVDVPHFGLERVLILASISLFKSHVSFFLERSYLGNRRRTLIAGMFRQTGCLAGCINHLVARFV